MALDYDLVIIGSSPEAIYAAQNAVQLQARVALVTQSDRHQHPPEDLLVSLREIGNFNYQLTHHPFSSLLEHQPTIALSQARNWLQDFDSPENNNYSLANLAVLGVDVIVGRGEFYSQPELGFQVAGRKLRSRNFLLATGTSFLTTADKRNFNLCMTPQDLARQNLADLPQQIIIVGSEPFALELAQTLARFEREITLVVETGRILPQEDPDIAILIQAQLEAEGIKLFTGLKVSQIKAINGQKWIQAGDRALVADEIIMVNCRQPNITGLNLAAVNVKYDGYRVKVSDRLRTTNPRIYACGDLIGGYCLATVARYEVNLILKNTLFFPWYKADYSYIPWAVFTQPNLARVGLNEVQAQQQYENLYIIKQYFQTITQAQRTEKNSGVCKLIVRENGIILGCSLVGNCATELIPIIALMIQEKIKLERNPMRGLTSLSIATIYPSMAEILQEASNNYYRQKLQKTPQLLKRLQTWFSIRKNWQL